MLTVVVASSIDGWVVTATNTSNYLNRNAAKLQITKYEKCPLPVLMRIESSRNVNNKLSWPISRELVTFIC